MVLTYNNDLFVDPWGIADHVWFMGHWQHGRLQAAPQLAFRDSGRAGGPRPGLCVAPHDGGAFWPLTCGTMQACIFFHQTWLSFNIVARQPYALMKSYFVMR